jgi:phosphoserine phosphatase
MPAQNRHAHPEVAGCIVGTSSHGPVVSTKASLRFKREGWLVYLVSSSHAHVVRQFAKKLQADGVFATELEIADGMYTGEICGPVYNGKEKLLPVIQISESCRIPTELCHAYGDHFSDQFMLSSVGKAFAVNPDKRLRRLAMEKNWEVLSWTPP